jgi:glutamine amidotransferase
MRVVIVDYGSGNLRSAAKAFERQAAEVPGAVDIVVTDDPETIRTADRVVLPGVGAFADCRAGLLAIEGVAEALEEAVHQKGRPFLGICVGMQLLAERGLEHGTHRGLGWIAGDVSHIEPGDPRLKIPHMGWNTLTVCDPAHPLFDGIATGAYAYFVHSYAFRPTDPTVVRAYAEYGQERIVAAIARDNIAGTQFHPEKSQETGLRLIANFLTWTP